MTLAKGGPMMLANSPDHGPMMLATDNWLMPIKLPPSLQRGRHTLEDDVAWAVCASLAWHSPRDLGSASSSFCQSCPTESDYGTGFCLIVIGRGGCARHFGHCGHAVLERPDPLVVTIGETATRPWR